MLDVNMYHVVALAKLYLPQLNDRSQGGFISVSSITAHCVMPLNTAYCASKAFCTNFTAGVALDGLKNVDVLCL